ncbi:MAG TPA: hypothetical protein VLI05_01780 [Candidatus Saccharimonadia bacterium]|nr:hypothetical protein [Candidatus Saccharimonadia bacterium]
MTEAEAGQPETNQNQSGQSAALSKDLMAIVEQRRNQKANVAGARDAIVVAGSTEYNAAERQKELDKDPPRASWSSTTSRPVAAM